MRIVKKREKKKNKNYTGHTYRARDTFRPPFRWNKSKLRGRVFPAATLQSGKPSVKSIDKASSRSAPSGEAALRCKSHVFAQQHEALKHAITSNSRRTIKFISKLKKGKKKKTGTREEKQATNLPFTGSFHSVCFIRDVQNVLQVLFFSSRVSVIFFSLSLSGEVGICAVCGVNLKGGGGGRALVVTADISHPVLNHWMPESSHSHPVWSSRLTSLEICVLGPVKSSVSYSWHIFFNKRSTLQSSPLKIMCHMLTMWGCL